MELTIEQALQRAIDAHKTGRLKDAEKLYRAILQVQPQHPDANHNLGVLAVGVGQPQAALPHLKAALEANRSQRQFWVSYINALIETKQIKNASELLKEAKKIGLTGEPITQLQRKLNGHSEHKTVSQILKQNQTSETKKAGQARAGKRSSPASQQPSQQRINELLASYNAQNFDLAQRQAQALITAYPTHAFGWTVLGVIFKSKGKLNESLELMRQPAKLTPHDAHAHYRLGNALYDFGRLTEAEASYREAIRLKPEYVQAHFNLGVMLYGFGRFTEAEASYREAIRLKPDYAQAYSNLGVALKDLGRLTDAAASFREAIRLKPDYVQAHNNLGNVLKDLGRLTDAEASFREAIRLKYDYAEAHSNLLISQNYVSSLVPESALIHAKGYGNIFSAKAQEKFYAWKTDSNSKTFKIGFVSGDFRKHPVGYFIEGLLKHLDRCKFELYAFPTMSKQDALTDRLKSYFDHWLPVYGKTDQDAATLIHEQGVNILFDLSDILHRIDCRFLPTDQHQFKFHGSGIMQPQVCLRWTMSSVIPLLRLNPKHITSLKKSISYQKHMHALHPLLKIY